MNPFGLCNLRTDTTARNSDYCFKGILTMTNVKILLQNIVLDVNPNILFLFYFTGNINSTCLSVNANFNKTNKSLEFFPTETVIDISAFRVYFNDQFLGNVKVPIPSKLCDCCNSYNMLPMLMVKALVYEHDGTCKLLGLSVIDILQPVENRQIYLKNVSLEEFLETTDEFSHIVRIDASVVRESNLLEMDESQFILASNLENVDVDELYAGEYKLDNPFPIFDRESDELALGSRTVVEHHVVPRSYFFCDIGWNFHISSEWSYCLLYHHFIVHGMDPEGFAIMFISEFLDGNIDNIDDINKVQSFLASKKQLWNFIMNVIINSILIKILSSTKYAIDDMDIEIETKDGKFKRTTLPNDRYNCFEYVAERHIDCEDGAYLAVAFYQKVLNHISNTMENLTEVQDNFRRIMVFMMSQYVPVLAVMETMPILSNEDQPEMFYHMGALLLPKGFFLSNIKKVINDNQFELNCISDLKLDSCNVAMNNQVINHVYLQPLVMESTLPVYADTVADLSVELNNNGINSKNTLDNAFFREAQLLLYPGYNNLKIDGKPLNEFYNRIIAFQTDYFMKHIVGNVKATTFYVKNDGKSSISLTDLIKYNEEDHMNKDDGFYFKYVIKDDVKKNTKMIMNSAVRTHEFDLDWEVYSNYIKNLNNNLKHEGNTGMFSLAMHSNNGNGHGLVIAALTGSKVQSKEGDLSENSNMGIVELVQLVAEEQIPVASLTFTR